MKGVTTWSFSPFRPFLFESGDITISRLIPGRTAFSFHWLPAGLAEYAVYVRREGLGEFSLYSVTGANTCTVEGLAEDTDYEFYVSAGDKRSHIRLVRTGKPVGVIVNYLHPRDKVYSFSGQYLCSPSLVRHPGGYLLASMDVYEKDAPQNLTLLFRSDDDGDTWRYVTELMPCFWGKLFVHSGALYMLGCSTEYGDLLLGRSDDGGETFCVPTILLRGSCKCDRPGIHKNPQPVVEFGGRLWVTLEWGTWGAPYGTHAPMVGSVDRNADLLDASHWHFTPPLPYNPSWEGTANGPSSGNIEGTLVAAPDGKLYNVMRYDMTQCAPNFGLALRYRVITEDPDAPLCYDHPIKLPGNHAKFMVKRDPVSERYYTIISRIRSSANTNDRNLLSLMVSPDAEHWSLACDLIDRTDCDPALVGFQYVDFLFEGGDLLYLCRTAINGAHSFHDSNQITFHRLRGFRELTG